MILNYLHYLGTLRSKASGSDHIVFPSSVQPAGAVRPGSAGREGSAGRPGSNVLVTLKLLKGTDAGALKDDDEGEEVEVEAIPGLAEILPETPGSAPLGVDPPKSHSLATDCIDSPTCVPVKTDWRRLGCEIGRLSL